jgi:type IV secretory pathway TraG/TraD family ATPase VirD4
MSNPRTREQDSHHLGEGWFWLILAGVVVGLWLLFWAGQALVGNPLSINPMALIHTSTKDTGTTVAPAGFLVAGVLLVLLVLAVIIPLGRRRRTQRLKPGQSVRHATKNLASRTDIDQMSIKAVAKRSEHLNLVLPEGDPPGQLLGRELGTGKEVWLDYETLTMDMWAARYGKSTGRILPMILSAPGAVVTTSNKPDVVNDSLRSRRAVGDCYIGDPQRIWADPSMPPAFWIDPLNFIRRRPEDEWDGAAEDLARLFASDAGIKIGSGGNDEQWRSSGAEMLSCFLLAATVSGRSVLDILDWVYDESNRESLEILTQMGWPSMAMKGRGSYELVDKTRSGVFFSLRNMVNPLTKKLFQKWITPTAGIPEFNPSQFVADHVAGKCPTLYLLSDKQEAGSASLLVLLLTVWTAKAAEQAARANGGRLATPLFLPLDEVANTVLWAGLPDVYSYYGSMGIIICSVFQSFRQPKRILGEVEARDLETNATLIIGGGIKDAEFLKEASTLIGEHEARRVSYGTDSASFRESANAQWQERTTLTPAEIRNLDPGMMIVIPQKNRPMIVESIPFWERTYRPEIEQARASLDAAENRAGMLAAAEANEMSREGA